MKTKLLDRLAMALSPVTMVQGRPEIGVAPYMQRQPWPMPEHFLDFPKAASLVSTVFACVTRIANDVAALQPVFHQRARNGRLTKIERDRGNVADLYARANPVDSGFELERDRQFTLDVNGNSYFYFDRMGRPDLADADLWELYVLPGHLVRPVAGPKRTVRKYLFGLVGRVGAVVEMDPENVIPFRYVNPNWNPLEPAPMGTSPLEAARLAYEARYNMGRWQQEFYANGGMVSHLFNVKDGASLTEASKRKYTDQLRDRAGLRNAFAPILVDGLEIMRAGLTVAEMQFMEAARLTDADVCRVYGMPPSIIGVHNEGAAVARAGAETIFIEYVDGCLRPRVLLRDSILSERLCPYFGDDVVCKTDMSAHPAVQEAMLNMAKTIVMLTGRPVLTVNEGRERMQTDPSDDPSANELAKAAQTPGAAAPGIGGTRKEAEPSEPGGGAGPSQTASHSARLRHLHAVARPRVLARRRADKNLARYERRVAAEFREMFAAQEKRVVAQLSRRFAGARASRFSMNADEVDIAYGEEDRARLQQLFEDLIATRGEEAAAEVGTELAVREHMLNAAAFISEQVERALAHTTATTREAVRAALAEVIAGHGSLQDATDAVREAFDGRRDNAETIARTETLPAYNWGALEAWKSAGVSEKSWLTAGDEAVREEHAATEDAGPVAIGDAFDVGGFPAMYPGDPSLPPELAINCRCVVQAEGVEAEAEGDEMARYFASPNGHGRVPSRIAAALGTTS